MRERLDRTWPSLVALIGTVGVVVALLILFGDNTGNGSTDDVAGDAGSAGQSDESGGDGQEPTNEPTDEPSDNESADDGENGADESGSTETPDDEPTTAPAELRSPVGIANQTSIEGLELTAAERLEAGGWEVPAMSGFTGNVPETTVYYPPGMQEHAEALSRQFPEIGRVRSTFEGVNQDRLVVILVEDYPDEIGE